MLVSSRKPRKSPFQKLLAVIEPIEAFARAIFLQRGSRSRRRKAKHSRLSFAPIALEALEARELLYGYIQVQNQPQSGNGGYTVVNTSTFSAASPGVLSGANGSDPPFTAHLVGQASHGTATVNANGSWTYTADTGYTGSDSFTFDATDGQNDTSNTATVSLNVIYGVLSTVDQTKLPADTLTEPMQILGSSSGQPGTAANLSLVYHSSTASPSQVLEEDVQLSMQPVVSNVLEISDTFNGSQVPITSVTTSNLSGDNPTIRLSQQESTSSLATGRYAYTQNVNSMYSQGATLISSINGAANVVNDQSSPFGVGWEMPGIYHIYQNSAANVPAGVLLTMGDGNGSYFVQGSGNSYTSPNGPEAFSTLVSLSGGGWQLTNQYGTVFTFNSSGYLTSTELRTTETTDYGWTNGDLTSITDAFGRVVSLGYTNGLLSSITNFASSVWSFGHDTSNDLTSITEPNPGNGSPVWSFSYNSYLLTNVTDPNTNVSKYAFNSYNNLASDTLPGGAGETYDSEQNYGYGSPNQGQPTNAVLSSSVANSTKDANGNTSYFTTDLLGNVLASTDPYGNVTTYTRDQNGLVTKLTQPPPATGDASPVTTFTYDSLGNETSASGANPTYGTYTFNAFSEKTSFTNSTNDEWQWSYDTHGNLLSETLPSNDTTTFTVDSLGYPLTMTQPAPNDGSGTVTTTYTRDSYERLTKITWPDNTTETFAYNSIDLPTSVTDEDNHATVTAYNVLGQVTTVTNAANGVTAYTYDANGNVLTVTDPMQEETSYEWTGRNQLEQETLPVPAQGEAAPVLAWTYDANGNELTYTNALNEVTSYTWDKMDRMLSETLPAPAEGQTAPTTSFSYDNISRKVSETNALNGTTTWAYGNTDVSQITSMTLPPPIGSGTRHTTTYGYDSDGRQNTVTDSMNHTTTTTFTADGQVATVADNLNATTTYSYGHGQELLSVEDPDNHTVSYQYDSRYRQVETVDANNNATQVTLDGVGNETKLVDGDNNATSWTYSATNQPLTETNSLGTTTTGYNADGLVTSIEDADGRVRDFVYNGDNELTAENWMSGSTIVETMSYGYDLSGQLTSASDPNSAYAFTFDGDGNLLSVDNNGTPNVPRVVLTNTFDLLGDRTSQAATIAGTADYLNSYCYDADQNLTTVTQQDQTGGNVVSPKEIDYSYNALGQPTSVVDYNTLTGPRTDVLTGTYTYDGANRLTGIAYTSDAGANSIDTLGWTYDDASNVATFSSIDGTATYGYDPTNQLTSATYTTASGGHQPANESFSFDASGNRNSTGYTTTSPNLMSSDGTYDYQYDADGNMVSRTQIASTYNTQYKTTFTWDFRNRLTDVEYYDNNDVLTEHVHYVYDVFDDLLATEVDTTGDGTFNEITHYVLDVSPQVPVAGQPGTTPSQPVFEFDGNGDLIQRNLVARNPTGVDAVMVQGTVNSLSQADTDTFAADDDLGTPHDIVSSSGTVLNHIVDTAFGQTAYQSDASVAWWAGFQGGHFDQSASLVNDYHRWYDPASGRWISEDPEGFRAGDANLSRAMANMPTGAVDPTGLVTGEIGVSVDINIIFIHYEGEVGLYGGFSTDSFPFVTIGIGGTGSASIGLGIGCSAGICGSVTSATNVGALEGEGNTTGVNTPWGGANYISGDDYGGISVSTPGAILDVHSGITETGMWNTGPDGPASAPDWVWPWDPNASWNPADTWNLWFGGQSSD